MANSDMRFDGLPNPIQKKKKKNTGNPLKRALSDNGTHLPYQSTPVSPYEIHTCYISYLLAPRVEADIR